MRFVALAITLFMIAVPRLAHASEHEEALADGAVDAEDLVGGATSGRRVPRSAPGGHAWISLVGFSMPTLDGRRDVGGFVVVGFPFDRVARTEARTALADPPKRTSKATPPPKPSPSPPPEPAPSPPSSSLPVPPPPPTATPPPSPPPIAITRPIARACVGAAWRAAGLGADDARLDAIVSRARLSGVLPEARLRVIRWEGAHLYDDTPSETTIPRDSSTASLGLEARLTWRLDRLLFADDEPSFERIRLERQDARAKVAGRALEALFHWQRAVLDLHAAERGSRDETEAALKIAETEAVLDVLTDGWFSQTALTGSGGAR